MTSGCRVVFVPMSPETPEPAETHKLSVNLDLQIWQKMRLLCYDREPPMSDLGGRCLEICFNDGMIHRLHLEMKAELEKAKAEERRQQA